MCNERDDVADEIEEPWTLFVAFTVGVRLNRQISRLYHATESRQETEEETRCCYNFQNANTSNFISSFFVNFLFQCM